MPVYIDISDSGNAQFEKPTAQIPKTFQSNKKEYPLFAGININKAIDGHLFEQESYEKGLTPLGKLRSSIIFAPHDIS